VISSSHLSVFLVSLPGQLFNDIALHLQAVPVPEMSLPDPNSRRGLIECHGLVHLLSHSLQAGSD
jgi:hypothetical protein